MIQSSAAVMQSVLCIACGAALTMPTVSAVQVIPEPVDVRATEGLFTLDADTQVVAVSGEKGAEITAEYCASVLRPATGYELPVVVSENAPDNNAITLVIKADDALGKEGYRLTSTSRGVTIAAPTATGLFYGVQTLRQLLPASILSAKCVDTETWTIPNVMIEDYPRFGWRGVMVDVARYFQPKEVLFDLIDAMALHKLNTLHIHLTDDQGWRIEIKKYPKLTEVGAWRDETLVGHYEDRPRKFDGERHGGFYTQEDIREIVAYAQARHINIVPEIEMPGHAQAAIAAYPELGNLDEKLGVLTYWGVNPNIFNGEESTILFLQDVLTEVMDLFPSRFIHIGGDEAVKEQWEASERVQARIKELGLKDEHEMQSYIIRRMDQFLAENGRRLIGWDEILEGGLAKGATVMSWRGTEGGIAAAKAGHDVVMAPYSHTYFDYYQAGPEGEPLAIGGNLSLEKVYAFEPIPEELTAEEGKHILGAQGQLWTEYIETQDYLEYMAFPRTCALAEVVWSPRKPRDYDEFVNRLKTHLKRLEYGGVNYRKLG